MEAIPTAIENRKKEFMLHNIVRLREMIRYLPARKLDLFREIPFLIHVNSPQYPAYIKSAGDDFGLWNFEYSGFAKDFCAKDPNAAPLIFRSPKDPAVQGLYHIGSLGTFTQSAKSDFDYWVVIDNSRFDHARLKHLHEKLSRIVTHSRQMYDQEVSFFVHDAGNLANNQFDEGDADELIAVPKMLIKEEFYRTFIMVAGKIPLWCVVPSGLDENEARQWKRAALKTPEFIDLGVLTRLPVDEIRRGLLWQISKAHYDPVKALIKGIVTASYLEAWKGDPNKGTLLCDAVKARFSQSIIDDYAADPYILAFERVLQYCTAMNDPAALAQIRAAIFFRLCGFPLVCAPPADSPKRTILDRYIRQWQLSGKQLKKLLDYQNWAEAEKRLFDNTMLQRLTDLYQFSLPEKERADFKEMEKITPAPVPAHQDADFLILFNKALKIIKPKTNRLPSSSAYLRLKPHAALILTPRKEATMVKGHGNEWLLFSRPNEQSRKPKLIYTAKSPIEAIGWCFYNRLFVRGRTQLEIRSSMEFSTSFKKMTGIDELYLNLEPWMPLSDDPFASSPCWEKIIVVLISYHRVENIEDEKSPVLYLPDNAEFLLRNSWGEIFFESVSLPQTGIPDQGFGCVAHKIINYHQSGTKAPAYTIFQFTNTPHPEAIRIIKTIVEDTRLSRQDSALSLTKVSRPYLDRI